MKLLELEANDLFFYERSLYQVMRVNTDRNDIIKSLSVAQIATIKHLRRGDQMVDIFHACPVHYVDMKPEVEVKLFTVDSLKVD